jgi:hypothetical protein
VFHTTSISCYSLFLIRHELAIEENINATFNLVSLRRVIESKFGGFIWDVIILFLKAWFEMDW